NPSRWTRLLLRVAAFRASDAELGDMLEEYANGGRGTLWLCRQILSTLGRHPRHATMLSMGSDPAPRDLRTTAMPTNPLTSATHLRSVSQLRAASHLQR